MRNWLKNVDDLKPTVKLAYSVIRTDDYYAYVLARLRLPDGGLVPRKDWSGSQGCESDPADGEVEGLLELNPDKTWKVLVANRCADDVIMSDEVKQKYQLPKGVTNQM